MGTVFKILDANQLEILPVLSRKSFSASAETTRLLCSFDLLTLNWSNRQESALQIPVSHYSCVTQILQYIFEVLKTIKISLYAQA